MYYVMLLQVTVCSRSSNCAMTLRSVSSSLHCRAPRGLVRHRGVLPGWPRSPLALMHRYHYTVGLAWSSGLLVCAITAVHATRQRAPCRCSRGSPVAAVLFWKDLRCAGTRLMP